MSFAYNILIY